MNLTRLLVQTAARRPDLRIGTIDDQMTLRDALGYAAAAGARMRADELTEHDRVAIVASTSTDFVVAWLGCLLAGIPVALINPSYPTALHQEMLGDLGVSAVIVDSAHSDLGFGRIMYNVIDERAYGQQDPQHAIGLHAGRFTIASFMHTSGTTGPPKFCAQSHEYFLRLGRVFADALRLSHADRVLAPLPLFHINPLGYGVIGGLTAASDVLALKRFSASEFWPAVKDNGITTLIMHSPPVEILKRKTRPSEADGHQIRAMFYADAEFMSRFGIEIALSAYGSTEAGGVSHLRSWSANDAMPSDVGRHGGSCRSDVSWRLAADGEILVRERQSGALFSGYVSQKGFDAGLDEAGWFHTGDVGRVDEDDQLVFVERRSESIRVKGEYLPIPYVEAQFSQITEIDDVAIWKIRSDLVDDEVVLFVSCTASIPLESISEVALTLPRFMRPRRVVKVPVIPRDGAVGKVQRRLLEGATVLQAAELG